MFPTTCVTLSHTSLPADPKMCFRLISRECSAWFCAACPEAIKAPLQGECWDTHTHPQRHRHGTAGGTGSRSCTLHWCPTPVTSITRPGHQGLSPSKPSKSCCVLASKLQLTEGDSPPHQDSLCGNRGKTLLWDKSAVCKWMGTISSSFSLRKDICPWLLLSLLSAHPHGRGK